MSAPLLQVRDLARHFPAGERSWSGVPRQVLKA